MLAIEIILLPSFSKSQLPGCNQLPDHFGTYSHLFETHTKGVSSHDDFPTSARVKIPSVLMNVLQLSPPPVQTAGTSKGFGTDSKGWRG